MSKPKKASTQVYSVVRISLHAPGGEHYNKSAKVSLKQKGKSIELRQADYAALYEGKVKPGTYSLEVSATGMQTPRRSIDVPASGKTASVYLGKRDWPYYRLGENIVPFEPLEELLAVVFPSNHPDNRTAVQMVELLIQKLPLKPLEYGARNELPFTAAEGAIWLFTITESGARERLNKEIPRLLKQEVRVGLPVDLNPGRVKVIDGRFIIRFRAHLKPAEIEALAKKADARILRDFIQAGNARLIEFQKGSYREQLNIVEEWFRNDLLVYGEPDIVAEFTDDAFPADPPNDTLYGTQTNLTLQDVDNAWQ
ncbi:MAG TPA: hypothetical protein VN743_06115, partial [Blastocatellia bacterium]|nr:hypothetical protein [Blastocatellia bacterium]